MKSIQFYQKKVLFYLNEGYNVLLNGVGDKKQIIHKLHSKLVRTYPTLILNAYKTEISIKIVQNKLSQDLFDIMSFESGYETIQEFISSSYSQKNTYLIIISSTNENLLLPSFQKLLSRVCSITNVLLIICIDNIHFNKGNYYLISICSLSFEFFKSTFDGVVRWMKK